MAIVIDTETTGLTKKDRILELAIIDWESGNILFLSRFNPEIPIPIEASNIHGIKDDDVKNCGYFRDSARELLPILETTDAVIGYNTKFDTDMLDAEYGLIGINVRWPTIVCAKRTWDVFEPKIQRNLKNAYRRFAEKEGFANSHSALADVTATREVLKSQIKQFSLEGKSWEEFDPEQNLRFCGCREILVRDGDLYVNFGKHTGSLVADVNLSFWRWVMSTEFPDPVTLMALEMTWMGELNRDQRREKIAMWAKSFMVKHEGK